MNRKHLELTAKLWGLALIAHSSEGVDELSNRVRRLASKRAVMKLRE